MQINPVNTTPARFHRGRPADERWRSARHPLFAVLRQRGQSIRWLAGEIKYSRSHVKAVSAGQFPALARFRAACASKLDRDEADLFHEHDVSSAPPQGEGESVRAGAAVPGSYPRLAGLSILEEAPQTRSA